MRNPYTIKPSMGFGEEERRLRQRMLELGVKQTDIANTLNIQRQDVSAVVRGISRSPRYVAEVYKYLGLNVPAHIL